MRTFSRLARALCAVAALASAAVAGAKPVPPTIEQLAAYPKMSSFSLSPDGQHLAALEGRGEDRVVLVWKTDALNQPPTVLRSERMKIQQVQFIKNDLLAVSMWQPYDSRLDRLTKTFITKLFITDLQGKNWREPMAQERAMSVVAERIAALANPAVLDALPNDPDHILVVNDGLDSSGDVFKVNVRTNRGSRLLRADEKVAGYVTDLDGVVRARTRIDLDGAGDVYIAAEVRASENSAWVEHFRSLVKARDIVQIVGFAKDPNVAYLLSNVGKDKAVLSTYDLTERKQKEVLFESRFFDAAAVRVNRRKDGGDGGLAFGDVTSIVYRGPRDGDTEWVSPKLRAMEQQVRQALGLRTEPLPVLDPATGESARIDYAVEATVSLTAMTPDLRTAVVVVSGSARPPEHFLLRDAKLLPLSKTYPDIDRRALGKTTLVYYKARDGLDVPGFLTTPDAELCGAGPWPAVVHPHGGPWARDAMDFDGSMWVPLMVSRCIAVLRPQFRGSAGWGRHLWKAGDAEWGQKMQDDKDDGAAWLVRQRVAIPERIAMFGFSYGGYSAMAASVRAGGPYKCAIAGAGVSDIKKIGDELYTNPFFRQAQGPTVAGLNPVEQAGKLQIPILVYQGDRDRIVPPEQSEWFVDRAKRNNQPVIYREFADYGHGPAWTRKTMGEQLGLIEDYLLRGCGGSGL